jgi:hypothetical protein
MSNVRDDQELAQDFIRLLRNENSELRKQVQELEQRVVGPVVLQHSFGFLYSVDFRTQSHPRMKT